MRPARCHRLLEPLAKHRISMTRIESRPSHRRKWDYVFFIDFEGHADEPHVAKALAELKKRSSLFRVLGSYPRRCDVSDMTNAAVIRPATRSARAAVEGELTVPGDKSISHRCVDVWWNRRGRHRDHRLSRGRGLPGDPAALQALGVRIERPEEAARVWCTASGLTACRLRPPSRWIWGTPARRCACSWGCLRRSASTPR